MTEEETFNSISDYVGPIDETKFLLEYISNKSQQGVRFPLLNCKHDKKKDHGKIVLVKRIKNYHFNDFIKNKLEL